jgi:hypothetical protein
VHRCGKTTLVTILGELANRAVVASNVSSPALFRVIEELQPTLLIDEVDTFLGGNDELRGILNAGCRKKTSFVYRVISQSREGEVQRRVQNGEWRIKNTEGLAESGPGPQDSSAGRGQSMLAKFSCWCPKAISRIGRLPESLADRCIVLRMQRKTTKEQCERIKRLEPGPLKEGCERFVAEHAQEIATATPEIPAGLNDRAADIWEPLLILAELAGGDWPETARRAAVELSANAEEQNPVGAFLVDILVLFTHYKVDRMFSRTMVEGLKSFGERPWSVWTRGKQVTELWLSQQLRPYGIRPRTLRIEEERGKGYVREDFVETWRRYISKADLDLVSDHEEEDATGHG